MGIGPVSCENCSVFKKGEGGPEAPGALRLRNKKATASVASSYSQNTPVHDWEGSTLRTRASDAGWLNGNISKRAVDLVPCLRFAPLRSQISSSFGTSATPLFLWIPFSKTCAIGASKIPYYRYRLSTLLSSGCYAPLRPLSASARASFQPVYYTPLPPPMYASPTIFSGITVSACIGPPKLLACNAKLGVNFLLAVARLPSRPTTSWNPLKHAPGRINGLRAEPSRLE